MILHKYNLNTDGTDSVNGYNVTNEQITSVTHVPNGKFDGAVKTYDGMGTSSNYWRSGSTPLYGGGQWTMMAWIKQVGGPNPLCGIFGQSFSEYRRCLNLVHYESGGNRFLAARYSLADAGPTTYEAAYQVDIGLSWHHVAVTSQSDATMRLYYDGDKVAEIYANYVGSLTTENRFRIGKICTYTGGTIVGSEFNGYIDDVEIHDTGLTPDQIKDYYANFTGAISPNSDR